MHILVTGANGQLGRRFVELYRDESVAGTREGGPGVVTVPLERPEEAAQSVRRLAPDWVLHAGAMTDVDGCERDPQKARLVNATATGALAAAARDVGARMAYVSTDYVYDGARGSYRETDATAPLSVYGATKLEGEEAARRELPGVLIGRTSVVFGPHKKNFVTWLVGELRAARPVRIVDDQRVSPTYTTDLAEQLHALMHAGEQGVFHTAGATALSRLDMAREIADVFGLDASLITPIRSNDLKWLARRPPDATLDVSAVSKYKRPMTFREALGRLKTEMG